MKILMQTSFHKWKISTLTNIAKVLSRRFPNDIPTNSTCLFLGRGCSSVVEHLPSLCETMGSKASTAKKKKKKKSIPSHTCHLMDKTPWTFLLLWWLMMLTWLYSCLPAVPMLPSVKCLSCLLPSFLLEHSPFLFGIQILCHVCSN
jgi:hypothetical protein